MKRGRTSCNAVVAEILKKHCAKAVSAITDCTPLSAIGLDSLSFVAALVEIEETFGIEFELDELEFSAFKTAGGLLASVEQKRREINE